MNALYLSKMKETGRYFLRKKKTRPAGSYARVADRRHVVSCQIVEDVDRGKSCGLAKVSENSWDSAASGILAKQRYAGMNSRAMSARL